MDIYNAAALDAAIRAIEPKIDGISIGNDSDKNTWAIQYQAGATNQTAAQAALSAFTPSAISLADKMDQVQFKIAFNHENRIRVLESKVQLTVAQFKAALTTLLGG